MDFATSDSSRMNAAANPKPQADHGGLLAYINVKLALLGFDPLAGDGYARVGDIVSSLIAQYREKERLLANHLCPADGRIQTFLYDYLLPIFTDAVGEDDMEHTRQTLFAPGNLAQPYHSINTDVHKRIRYLEPEAA